MSAPAVAPTIAERALRVREEILQMAAGEHGAHVGGGLSATDVLCVLYLEVLRLRPDEPDWPGRDRFVLSKGHASAALYAVLAEAGFLEREELETYCRPGSRLAGHPLRRLPGVEFPTGSLGHGLSLATGIALGLRRARAGSRAFALLGDGELQEGSVWEAAMLAGHLRLGNLTAIVDRNRLQITGSTEDCVALEPLADRWRAFGWDVVEVDGHDHSALRTALTTTGARPTMVLAHTVKGAGVPMFEGDRRSHAVKLSPRNHRRALAGLRTGAAS
ncbi:transketolase [Amycolatopsis sp. NPDC047767]|uniref:transketolase n=1 Tax=Amycolatopsis sp. NPDC047767 TaxID=3156765 RepID=UPI0034562AF6